MTMIFVMKNLSLFLVNDAIVDLIIVIIIVFLCIFAPKLQL